jgi:catechol 2,3-dioxygenase-like lactoylglutathione lyase family enzyme
MSRLHVHLHVRDLENSIRFYKSLFGTPPVRVEAGYAKWMLEDPRVNFAISAGGSTEGVGHLGIQVENDAELAAVTARAREAAGEILVERGARCCHAAGNKAWAEDPQGVRWEAFQTTGTLDEYEEGADEVFLEHASGMRTVTAPHAACGCGCESRKGGEAGQTQAACCA